MEKVLIKYPWREELLNKLAKLYQYPDHGFPQFVYLLGFEDQMAEILKLYFSTLKKTKSVVIDATECYSSKVLFDLVLNGLKETEEPETRADDMNDFLDDLSQLDQELNYIIAIENAQKLRDLDFNVLPVFVKLSEFTSLNISCILSSCIPLEKMHPKLALSNAIKIQIPPLNKVDLIKIFLQEYPAFKVKIFAQNTKALKTKEEEEEKVLKILKNLDEEFYENYLTIFFGVFYKVCRDLKELRFMCKKCYHLYYAPILSGEININDIKGLWKNISNPMQQYLTHLHSRINTQSKSNQATIEPAENQVVQSKFSHVIELPYYTKYLLIAAFLASHNDPKADKRLFMKHHGKQRKKAHDIQKQAKVRKVFASFFILFLKLIKNLFLGLGENGHSVGSKVFFG